MTDTTAAPAQIFTITDDGELQLHLHRYQWQTMHSQAQNIFLLKGWRAGFTSYAPFWLMDEMRRCGPGNAALNYFAAVPTLASARSALIPEVVRIFTEYYKLATYNKNENCLYTTDDGERRLWGHKQREHTPIKFVYADDPTSFGSMTSIGGIGDEIGQPKFKLESYRTLLSRMATQRGRTAPNNAQFADRGFPADMKCGRLMAGSTVWNLGWVEDMWNDYMRGVKEAAQEYSRCLKLARTEEERVFLKQDFYNRWYVGLLHRRLHFIRFDSTANPTFPREEFEEARRTLPGWFFDMRYRALFRKPAGVIFDSWSASHHVYEPTENFNPERIPDKWPRRAAVDFGKRNFWALFIAHDEERDRHFLYKAYHDAQHSNEERGREMLKIEPRLEWTVAGQIGEGDDRAELAAGGVVSVAPAFKPIWPQLVLIASAVKQNKLFTFKGVSQQFESDMRTLTRPVDDRGNVDMDADPEELETFHTIAGLRYYATYWLSAVGAAQIAPRAGGRSSKPDALKSERHSSEAVAAAPAAPSGGRNGAFAARGDDDYRRALAQKYAAPGLMEPHLDIDL